MPVKNYLNGLTFYFVRHGETYFNLNQKTQGWCDPFLTPQGIESIRQSGRGLSQIKFDIAIVSDLQRTIKTAKMILEESIYPEYMTPIIEMPEFREIFFGSFEGSSSEETWQAVADYMGYPTGERLLAETTEVERLTALKDADPKGQAENYQDYCDHIDRGMEEILTTYGATDAAILFVGHSINIRYILQQLIPAEDQEERFKDIRSLSNASVTILNFRDGKFHLDAYNYTDHFQA